jgi:uncharacterized protein
MKMLRPLAMLALLLSAAPHALADATVSPEKRAAIEKLLELTGALKLGQQMSSMIVTQMTSALRAARPDVPAKALDVLPEVVNEVIAENVGSFKEVIVHIYDEHFSLEEVRGLNEFYASELGRKVVTELPAVLQESMTAGQQWGHSIAPQIVQRARARLKKENIEL